MTALTVGDRVRVRVPTGGVRPEDVFVVESLPRAGDQYVRVRPENYDPGRRAYERFRLLGYDPGSLERVP